MCTCESLNYKIKCFHAHKRYFQARKRNVEHYLWFSMVVKKNAIHLYTFKTKSHGQVKTTKADFNWDLKICTIFVHHSQNGINGEWIKKFTRLQFLARNRMWHWKDSGWKKFTRLQFLARNRMWHLKKLISK